MELRENVGELLLLSRNVEIFVNLPCLRIFRIPKPNLKFEHFRMTEHEEKQYLNLCEKILDHGKNI